MGDTVLGIAIMLVATSASNIGAVVQKKAVDSLPPFEGRTVVENVKSVLRTPLWLLGWLGGTGGLVLNMVALGLADISVVQPLNGFGLAVLALFSRWYLGERLTPAMLAGIAAVIAGVAVIGATVAESRAPAGAGEILAAYTNGLPALAGLVVAPLVVWAAARRAGRLTGVLYAVAAAAASVVGLTFSKGAFGLFAVVGLGAALSTWPTYALLGVMLCFSTLAMFLQQMSFQKGKAVVVTPVFAATSVVLPLLAGAVVFGERVAWLTFLAVLFIVVGVVVLGAARPAEVTDARAK